MQLDTMKFGKIEIDESSIIRFVAPILGFAEYERYALIRQPETAPILWLQSTEKPKLVFPIIEPFPLFPDYDFEVPGALARELQADGAEDICVFTIVVLAKDVKKIRTNLRAPVLYNPRTHLAKQVILEGTDYPVQFFFAARQADPPAAPSETLSASA